MSHPSVTGPKILIAHGSITLWEDMKSGTNSLPDLQKTLKEFQQGSNSALTELINKLKDSNMCSNGNGTNVNI